MDCPNCKIPVLNAQRYIKQNIIENLLFCPKCKLEILGEQEEGYIEIENLYLIKIYFESIGVNTEKIVKIRKLDKSISIQKLKNKLVKSKDISLGTYSRMQAESIYKKAIALKLNAKIIVA